MGHPFCVLIFTYSKVLRVFFFLFSSKSIILDFMYRLMIWGGLIILFTDFDMLYFYHPIKIFSKIHILPWPLGYL